MVRDSRKKKKPNQTERFAEGNRVSLNHFNLSRIKHLRTLEITAESIVAAKSTAADFLKTVLSSVASPIPINIVIIYRDRDFGGIPRCNFCGPESSCFSRSPMLMVLGLGMFREIHDVHDFRLVLCADVSDSEMAHSMEVLEVIAKVAQLPHEPLIISEGRTLCTRSIDCNVGWSGNRPIVASAL